MAEPGLARVRIESDGYVHNTRCKVGDDDLILSRAVITIDPKRGVVVAEVVLDELDIAIAGAEVKVKVGELDIHDVIRDGLTAHVVCSHADDLGCCADCRVKTIVDALVAARTKLAR